MEALGVMLYGYTESHALEIKWYLDKLLEQGEKAVIKVSKRADKLLNDHSLGTPWDYDGGTDGCHKLYDGSEGPDYRCIHY